MRSTAGDIAAASLRSLAFCRLMVTIEAFWPQVGPSSGGCQSAEAVHAAKGATEDGELMTQDSVEQLGYAKEGLCRKTNNSNNNNNNNNNKPTPGVCSPCKLGHKHK